MQYCQHSDSSDVGMFSEANFDFPDDPNSDEELRKSSDDNKNCHKSPLNSLELEFFSQQPSYATQYYASLAGGLCCGEDASKDELPSKTIKAATLALSSPRVLHKRFVSSRATSKSDEENAFSGCLHTSLQEKDGSDDAESLKNKLQNVEHHKSSILIQQNSKISDHLSLLDESHCNGPLGDKLCLKLPSSSSKLLDLDEQISLPTERNEFFKSFANLIQSKDNLHNAVSLDDQLSIKTAHHYIWLELLAWHRGCSLEHMENILPILQTSVPSVIDEVLNFSVTYDIQNVQNSKYCNVDEPSNEKVVRSQENGSLLKPVTHENANPSLTSFINDDTELPSLKQDDFPCECSDTLSRICQNCVDVRNSALKQVEAIVEKIDYIEHLHPSLKSLEECFPKYQSPKYQCRVKTLYLWLNITKSLRQKVCLLAKLLGIKDKAKAGWPCYEDDVIEETVLSTPLEEHDLNPGVRKIKFSLDVGGGSSSTSCSDHSELSRNSSPEVQILNPFDSLKSSPSVSEAGTECSRTTYRKYADRMLRHKGLKWMYRQLFSILGPILYRVHATLKKPTPKFSADVSAKVVTNKATPVKTPEYVLPINAEHLEELSTFGVWAKCFQMMALPTFHKPFFFLMRVVLDVVHECLHLRLEQQPAKPSALSVGQLIKECKEVLKAATGTRRKYINLAQTVLGENGSDVIEAQLDEFNSDLEKMLQVYLGYLESRMQLLKNASRTLHHKSYLEEEWVFMRFICPHIPGGEASASKKFCHLASCFISSIGSCLTFRVNEHITTFQECFVDHSEELSSNKKNFTLQTYRDVKHLFQDSSEQARQIVTLAKSLRKDLEIAAEYELLVAGHQLLTKLHETGHIRVIAPSISGHVMFVPGNLQHCERFIWQLVDMTCGHEALDAGPVQAVYLVMMQCSKTELKGLYWDGPTIILEPSAEANITLSHVEVDGLLLVVNHSSQLASQCKIFQKVMGNSLSISKPETSCNKVIAGALYALKSKALDLWYKLTELVKEVEMELCVLDQPGLEDLDKSSLLSSYREVLHQSYKFAFEYQKALSCLITGEARKALYVSSGDFAKMWMRFVVSKCEEGRGIRPRWAKQGLNFFITVYNSPFGQSLSESEFVELQTEMNRCICHLMGCVDRPMIGTQECHSPRSGILGALRLRHVRVRSSLSISSSDSNLLSPPILSEIKRKRSRDESSSEMIRFHENSETLSPIDKVRKEIEALELKQQSRLIEHGVIGSVSNVKIQKALLQVSARKVSFPWQRCFKIGEGRFGKVYTAVNNSTGELIAMKEIRLQPNDHRAIKAALDEIHAFEGIKHPHLVRYYGVEVHREEMLIFMEYCNEGSLESAAQLHLPESLIRKYTRQLLDAVNAIHENGIVHRDIKSANVFLTSDGDLKLGDFGCSVKLKNNTTMPGELCAFVGTPAYMAPEVFTKNVGRGHGRAADVWSLGCVVLEMLTAKRPWYDMENYYQIMYAVGTGGIPEIPEYLSEEAKDFLNKCLVLEPEVRSTTSQLLDHPFTKIQEE